MKKLLSVVLCLFLIVGCGAKSKSVPVKDGYFQIAFSELVEKVDKLSEGRGVPKLADLKVKETPGEGNILNLGFGAGDSVVVVLCFDKDSRNIERIKMMYNIEIPQEDAALQMGQYLVAFSKVLSPDAKMNFDPGAAIASMADTVYVEDNLKITITVGHPILSITIEPNQ